MHVVNLFTSLQLNLSKKRAASFRGGINLCCAGLCRSKRRRCVRAATRSPWQIPQSQEIKTPGFQNTSCFLPGHNPQGPSSQRCFHLMLASTNLADMGLSAARPLQVQLGEKPLPGITAGSAIPFQLLEQMAG